MTYYLSPGASGDGCTPASPRGDFDFAAAPGDSILLLRGTMWRGALKSFPGVTYGAYGEGEAPIINGAVDLSEPALWRETEPHIWRCLSCPTSDVGNFIFGEGDARTGATLRWEKGDLAAQGDFWDGRFAEEPTNELFLWSEKNPGEYYGHIECCVYGSRVLLSLQSGMTVENLTFIGSGVHAVQGAGKNITVRNCRFEFIGGCKWSTKLRIRFGNCVELWEIAEDVTVENCSFYQVYDSCVTHQGGRNVKPAVRFICRNNVFDSYGMAAFEYRDRVPVDSSFTGNVCRNAGVGFAMAGEALPRRSEIWPQPMGHHLFFWRMEHASEGGSLTVRDNVFADAPNGAAVYSIIAPEAEAQLCFADNRYEGEMLTAAHFGGKDMTAAEFAAME